MDASPTVVGALVAALYALSRTVEHKYLKSSGRFTAADRAELKRMCEMLLEVKTMETKLEKVIQHNTETIASAERATRALIHYVKWFAEKTTGESPPPPLPKV